MEGDLEESQTWEGAIQNKQRKQSKTKIQAKDLEKSAAVLPYH